MLTEPQREANWYFLWKVPQRYQHLSGLDKYDFKIRHPWHKPFGFALTKSHTVQRISPSAHCVIIHRDQVAHILISTHSHPELSQAILLLGQFHFSGNRTQKYLTLFKAYECIADHPKMEFAALRHALTHPDSKLNRPKTLAALHSLFGTTRVNLAKHTHLSRFYKLLGLLLIETDSLLYALLEKNYQRYAMDSNLSSVLLDWQVVEA